MLDRTARTILPLLFVAAAIAVAASTVSTWDVDAARRTLPSFESTEGRGVVSLDDFGTAEFATAYAMLRINRARMELQAERAVAQLAGGGRGARGIVGPMASMRAHRQLPAVRRLLDGIPARELALISQAESPRDPLDPWVVDVAVGIRDVAGTNAPFNSPKTSITLELRPYGEPSQAIVRRWHVTRISMDRSGAFDLAPDVTYLRRGGVALIAPTTAAGDARGVLEEVVRMLPSVRRDYPGLSRGGGVYVALVPHRSDVSRVYPSGKDAMDHAVGVAMGAHSVAILLPEYRDMEPMVRRSLIRHELVHLATERLARQRYLAYVEGVAEWEGNHEIVSSGEYFLLNGPAVTSMESGRVDLDRFLFEESGFDQLPVADRGQLYSLGMLTVDYIENEYGHARALRFYGLLGDGIEPRVAVRRAFGASPAAFRSGVKAWISGHRTWHG